MDQSLFGGPWTQKKLGCVEEYLQAYTKILSGKGFTFFYIDAFAGTGYRQIIDDDTGTPLFPELLDDEPADFLSGSAVRALGVKPPFSRYIFIEKDPVKYEELKKVVSEMPEHRENVRIINPDCNDYLSDLCRYKWASHRAVLFLDPFGMQVKWSTIECITKTKAIDMWVLFPLGMAVSRLLKKNGNIRESWKTRLDDIFGTTEWFREFYNLEIEDTLFGPVERLTKDANFDKISRYWVKRLKSVFEQVAEPSRLVNSRNVPLFLLCFASGNPKGAHIAVKIANHLLRKLRD